MFRLVYAWLIIVQHIHPALLSVRDVLMGFICLRKYVSLTTVMIMMMMGCVRTVLMGISCR